MKFIVIYSGRFQPFGKHHYQSYLHLCEKFGQDNVYICTSNHTDERSPLTFNEKVKFIQKYGISKIFQVKQPYKCTELTSMFDPQKTAIIFAYGRKDVERLNTNGYFTPYRNNNNLQPLSQCGYLYVLPHIQILHNNIEINGTNLRKMLCKVSPEEFTRLMGWYDSELDVLCKHSFYDPTEQVVESVVQHLTQLTEGDKITKTELMRIEQYIDKFFKQFNIDIDFQDIYKGTHFFQRLNDPRNDTPITGDDLRKIFKKVSIKHGLHLSKLNLGAEGVLRDMETDVNIPFVVKWDRQNQEIDLVPKTIMKKKNFKSAGPFLTVENFKDMLQLDAKPFNKHIQHPYEDKSATCSDLCQFVEDIILNPDSYRATIKYDGHNFQITYKDGQVLASRNKSTIVNPMTLAQVYQKFEGKGNIQITFTEAHKAMSAFLSGFDADFLNSVFGNGRTFLNFEILHPLARNVYDYGDTPCISLHSLITYDQAGNEITRSSDLPRQFKNVKQTFRNFKVQQTPTHSINGFRKRHVNYFQDDIQSNFDNKEQLKKIFWKLGVLLIPETEENYTNIPEIIHQTELNCTDVNDIVTVSNTLDQLNELGKFHPLNYTTEGLVIEWRNKLYKLTGAFGCLVPIFRIYNKARYSK